MQRITWIAVCSLAMTSTAFANAGESSFTPTSLYVPVRFVMLGSSTSLSQSSVLYRCASERDPSIPPDAGSGGSGGGAGTIADDGDAGTEVLADDCLVDMADDAALAALFGSMIDINPGTYDEINFQQCVGGAPGYSSFVKGQVELNGQTWYTTSGDAVLTTSAAENRHVQIDYFGCGSTIKLPHAVTLAAGDTVNISAFFSLRNLGWAIMSNQGAPGGCTLDSQYHNVCTGYPIPIASLSTDAPSLQTYFITEDQTDTLADKASGQMLLLIDNTGIAFGGLSRRLYSAHSTVPSVNYDTPIKTLTRSSDMLSYFIENYGGGGPNGPVDFYVRFPTFELQTHNGTMTESDGVTMVDYRAVLQQ
jgi:hypothetical protein